MKGSVYMPEVKYKRVLLKLSGEALGGTNKSGIDPNVISKICEQIKELVDLKVQVGIVVGGGNFWRGRNNLEMERTTADYIGMLATVMNSLALCDALEALSINAKVQSAIEMSDIVDPFDKEKAMRYLNDNVVMIFAGGTGRPFFSTDTAAALRATQIDADVILLAKTVDGIYSADPKIDPLAKKYDKISYMSILEQDLKVMDQSATSMCKDNNIPLVVFGLDKPENIVKIIKGETIGTIVE